MKERKKESEIETGEICKVREVKLIEKAIAIEMHRNRRAFRRETRMDERRQK